MTVSSIIELPVERSGATTKTHWIDPRVPAETRDIPVADEGQPRHIPHKAARGLEILGHAIEYLSEANGREGVTVPEERAHLQAVQLLMSLNRKIYFACPPVRSFRDRLYSFLHIG